MNPERIITIIVGLGGILAMIDSGVQRYNKSTKSRYAAERDFAHLQRNQEQMKQSIQVLLEENDSMNEVIIKMQTKVDMLIELQKEN